MKAPSPPPPPDPYKTAAAQASANISVAISQSIIGNADEVRPDGTVTFTIKEYHTVNDPSYDAGGNLVGYTPREIPHWLKTTAFSAKGQQQYDQQQDISIAMNLAALIQANQLRTKWATPFSVDQLPARDGAPAVPSLNTTIPSRRAMQRDIGMAREIDRERDVARQRLLEPIRWQHGVDRDKMTVALRRKGVVAGMEAFERAMRPFDRRLADELVAVEMQLGQEHQRMLELSRAKAAFHNEVIEKEHSLSMLDIEARNKMLMELFQAGMAMAQYSHTIRASTMQELLAERSQIINEVSSLMHGGQVQVPQFQAYNAPTIAQTPLGEYVYRTHAAKLQAWQTQVQSQSQMMGGMFGMFGSLIGMPFGG